MFEFLLNPSPRALAVHLARGDVRHIVAFDTEITGHDTLGPPVTAVQAALAETGDNLAKRAPDLSPAGLTKEAERMVDRSIKPVFQSAVEATFAARQRADEAFKRLHTPKFEAGSSETVRVERRNYARLLKLPVALEAAQSDPDLAAAIVEGGEALSGFSADIFQRLRREMAVGQLANLLATQHDYRTAPSADDPVAGYSDWEAARSAAAEAVAKVEAERELIGRVPAVLSSVVTGVAVMLESTRQQAFERLSA